MVDIDILADEAGSQRHHGYSVFYIRARLDDIEALGEARKLRCFTLGII